LTFRAQTGTIEKRIHHVYMERAMRWYEEYQAGEIG
jgi:hypothetical protein